MLGGKKAESEGIMQELWFISLTLTAVPVLAGEGLIATTLTASNKNLSLPPPSSVSFSVSLPGQQQFCEAQEVWYLWGCSVIEQIDQILQQNKMDQIS